MGTMPRMGIPSFDQFIDPLFQLLGEHPDGLKTTQVYAALAARLGLSEAERAMLLPSRRQPVYQNRIGWAHDRLKRGALSHSLKRGVWCLTDAGRAECAKGALPTDTVRALAFDFDSDTSVAEVAAPVPVPAAEQTPEELIDAAAERLTASVADDILAQLAEVSPVRFERIVLDLLLALGYGVSSSAFEQTGGTGDGGIDGIVSLDRLGLDKVYVQAKRWKGSVGRPEVQGFFGALAGRRASKGVFMTTSSFTTHALDYAAQVSDSLVLVDGPQMARLMISTGVGVSTMRKIAIVALDTDYFTE